MNLKNILSCIPACLAVLFTTGCEEQQLPTYDVNTHYVHFERMWDEVVRFSFQTVPGEDEHLIEIPVTLIGLALPEGMEYSVSVVTSDNPFVADGEEYVTTASDDVYDISLSPVFKEGVYSDNLVVTLHNVPELQEEKCIVLRIENNENFLQGPEDYLTSIIYVSDILSRPDWWDSDFETIFLGPYSDIKYEHFIIATGISDLSDMSVPDIQAYVRMYVSYLQQLDAEGTPLYESDGQTKVLDTIVYR